ncbi:hypothetical protein [Sulfurospirillum arcachonense]|uniref:hypothetical protein n=1 Tax=Sulfurospirillum arcachonense TaxID=57666 RepID=UPI0004682159|nr:hypothetical protein [Sulfurospirillum arcachonense]
MEIIKKSWDKILVLFLSILVVYLSVFSNIDEKTDSRIDISFKQAVSVFASAKALNAAISLVQGTEVGPPGVTITIGEVLDPINDLVEQFSWVMLASLTSLGIQKILMNIVTCNGFDIVLICILFMANVVYFYKDKLKGRLFFKFTFVLIFLRFSIPFMSYANEYVYVNFVEQEYSVKVSQNIVHNAKEKIDKFDDSKASYFSSSYYKKKLLDFERLIESTGQHIVDLIIIFLFQTILFPLLFLFVLYKFVIYLFNFNL